MVIDKFNYKEVLLNFSYNNTRLDPGTDVIFEVNGKSLHYRVAHDLFFLCGLNCWNERIFKELEIDAMKFCSELGVHPSLGAFPVMQTNQDFIRVIYNLFMCCEEHTIPPIELMDINLSFD